MNPQNKQFLDQTSDFWAGCYKQPPHKTAFFGIYDWNPSDFYVPGASYVIVLGYAPPN